MDPLGIDNIVRKIKGMEATGCVMAMYMAPGLDISGPVATALNQTYTAAGAAATSSSVTPAAATTGGNSGR
jgi:hypothetical protein